MNIVNYSYVLRDISVHFPLIELHLESRTTSIFLLCFSTTPLSFSTPIKHTRLDVINYTVSTPKPLNLNLIAPDTPTTATVVPDTDSMTPQNTTNGPFLLWCSRDSFRWRGKTKIWARASPQSRGWLSGCHLVHRMNWVIHILPRCHQESRVVWFANSLSSSWPEQIDGVHFGDSSIQYLQLPRYWRVTWDKRCSPDCSTCEDVYHGWQWYLSQSPFEKQGEVGRCVRYRRAASVNSYAILLSLIRREAILWGAHADCFITSWLQ